MKISNYVNYGYSCYSREAAKGTLLVMKTGEERAVRMNIFDRITILILVALNSEYSWVPLGYDPILQKAARIHRKIKTSKNFSAERGSISVEPLLTDLFRHIKKIGVSWLE